MSIMHIETGPRMSQAVIHGDTVYLAGQVGTAGASVSTQMTDALAGVERLLTEAGTSKNGILSVTIWLSDMDDFAEMNAVWDAWISDCSAPARATGEVKLAAPGYKVEVIVIAALNVP